jgi:hypothetical protein
LLIKALMADLHSPDVCQTIDDIVRQLRLPGARAREDLRRELESHFDAAGEFSSNPTDSLVNFGPVPDVVRRFQSVYRREFICLYAAKWLVAIVGAACVAETLFALAHLRMDAGGLHLSADFFRVYKVAIKLVLAMASAWEVGRRPFDVRRAVVALTAYCLLAASLQPSVFGGWVGWEPWRIPILILIGFLASHVKRASFRLPLMFLGFAGFLAASVNSATSRLPMAALLVAVWLLTEALFSWIDRAFAAWFDVSMDTAFSRGRQDKWSSTSSQKSP